MTKQLIGFITIFILFSGIIYMLFRNRFSVKILSPKKASLVGKAWVPDVNDSMNMVSVRDLSARLGVEPFVVVRTLIEKGELRGVDDYIPKSLADLIYLELKAKQIGDDK